MELPELVNDKIIRRLTVQPQGEHSWAQIVKDDPDQYNLYKNSTYTLLVRSHILGIYNGPDAFEVIMLKDEQVIFHEDVLEEDMNKESILAAIEEFNSKN